MFQGYCFFEDGSHTQAVTLQTAEEAITYVQLQMKFHREVRVVDDDDCTVLQAVNGSIVFPEAT